MPASTPWKLAVTGGVGIVAGVALVSVDWTLASLAAFAGLALVARGALYLVTSASFLGLAGPSRSWRWPATSASASLPLPGETRPC
jgi:hypothetical protein